MQLRSSERRLLVIGIAVIGVAWAVWRLPGLVANSASRDAALALARQVEADRLLLARAGRMGANVEAMARLLERMGVSEGAEESRDLAGLALAWVQQAARATGVQLKELRPGTPAKSGDLITLGLHVTLEASQATVFHFLAELERAAPRLVVERVQITGSAAGRTIAGSEPLAPLAAVISLSAAVHGTLTKADISHYREIAGLVGSASPPAAQGETGAAPRNDLALARSNHARLAGLNPLFKPLPEYVPPRPSPPTGVATGPPSSPAAPAPEPEAESPAPPAVHPVEPPSPPAATLRGVVWLGAERLALLATQDGERYYRVGDRLFDWTLTEIQETVVVFRQDSWEERLALSTSFGVSPLGSRTQGGSSR